MYEIIKSRLSDSDRFESPSRASRFYDFDAGYNSKYAVLSFVVFSGFAAVAYGLSLVVSIDGVSPALNKAFHFSIYGFMLFCGFRCILGLLRPLPPSVSASGYYALSPYGGSAWTWVDDFCGKAVIRFNSITGVSDAGYTSEFRDFNTILYRYRSASNPDSRELIEPSVQIFLDKLDHSAKVTDPALSSRRRTLCVLLIKNTDCLPSEVALWVESLSVLTLDAAEKLAADTDLNFDLVRAALV